MIRKWQLTSHFTFFAGDQVILENYEDVLQHSAHNLQKIANDFNMEISTVMKNNGFSKERSHLQQNMYLCRSY
jgi:hypothetical protein